VTALAMHLTELEGHMTQQTRNQHDDSHTLVRCVTANSGAKCVVGTHVTEQHPKVGTRMLTEAIQASYAASRYNPLQVT
jgi:hypothetical protein